MLKSLFYMTAALHVTGVTITHLQEHKTTVTTASGNRHTVIELNFYRLFNNPTYALLSYITLKTIKTITC
jgi:hypothetical protein